MLWLMLFGGGLFVFFWALGHYYPPAPHPAHAPVPPGERNPKLLEGGKALVWEPHGGGWVLLRRGEAEGISECMRGAMRDEAYARLRKHTKKWRVWVY